MLPIATKRTIVVGLPLLACYRHRSYVGDLSQKADVLRALGHELEARERWSASELEGLYDELYQLMLIAFAELSVADGGSRLRALRVARG